MDPITRQKMIDHLLAALDAACSGDDGACRRAVLMASPLIAELDADPDCPTCEGRGTVEIYGSGGEGLQTCFRCRE